MKRVEEGAGELVISRGDSAVDLVLFNFSEAPKPEQIKYVVGVAVKTFLAAYQRT